MGLEHPAHAPARGATLNYRAPRALIPCFNPRSHTGSDNSNLNNHHAWGRVSIHAPVRGATLTSQQIISERQKVNPLRTPAEVDQHSCGFRSRFLSQADHRRPGPHRLPDFASTICLLCRDSRDAHNGETRLQPLCQRAPGAASQTKTSRNTRVATGLDIRLVRVLCITRPSAVNWFSAQEPSK